MKKIILFCVFCLVSSQVLAKKSTYIYTDYRFNFVKLEEVDKKEAEQLAATHPYILKEEQIRKILGEIKLSRSFVMKKEVETQEVFSDRAINFLAHKIVEAFAKATPGEKVIISYLSKEPDFILRNDRLTIADLWVHENELHIEFEKLAAKLTGDYDKMGDFSKVVARSRGLRISLEIGEGQGLGSSASELVVNLNTATAVAEESVEAIAVTTVPPAAVSAQSPLTTRDRLKELGRLKDDGLVTEKEYKLKRKQILQGL